MKASRIAPLAAFAALAGPAGAPASPPNAGSLRARHAWPEDDLYKSPVGLAISPDGSRLFVACEDADEVLALDPAAGKVVAAVGVGRWPFALALSPDAERLYCSNREGDSISVIEIGGDGLRVAATWPAGDAPHGLVTDASGRTLYVANMHTDDVSLIDTQTGKERKRIGAGRYPFALARSRDGRRIYVSSVLSIPVPFREPSIIEITFIDAQEEAVVERRLLPSTVIAQGIAVTPDDRFVVVALELPKNLLPESQIFQGWMVTHGFAVLEAAEGGRSAFLLLDEPHLYFADAFGLAFSPDGRLLAISSSGADVVSIVDWAKVEEILRAKDGRIGLSDPEIERLSRHLAASAEYVIGRVPTANNPKEVVLAPDGRTLWVAERLADSVLSIDIRDGTPGRRIDLGGPGIVTPLRRGAQLFNYASVSFQRQLSCATCHPENHLDGLSYDIGLDGMGLNIVDNRTMRGIAETAPFKWSGKNPTIHRQEGPRAAQLFFRSHGYERDEDTDAVVAFIEALPLLENRYRRPDGKLNEFQKRGKRLFERAMTNDGRYIPIANRCITCHPPPYFTDRRMHDVGSKAPHDTDGNFDTPQLNNIHLQAPYLHDGRCYTLEEIWTLYNPDDTHGVTNDMMKEDLNDLIEYLKTL